MKRPLALFAFAAVLLAAAAHAALISGDAAPDFRTQASLGGNVFTFSLADALKKGPVVLYFYPAAFTSGCTIEAHDFAEATDSYRKLGASVIGVSRDDIETLQKFSVSECRNKFAVASDRDQRIMKAYDAVLASNPEYGTMPAKLRMNFIGSPGIDKDDFELFSLAVSAMNGCGMCIDSHERLLEQQGVKSETIQAAARIGAVMKAVATVHSTL